MKDVIFRAVAGALLGSGLLAGSAGAAGAPAPEKPIDPANMDLSVKPGDDFYCYANGTWLKNHPIPPDYAAWGSFTELIERNNAVLHEILEAAAADKSARPGSDEQKVGDFYASGMDERAIAAAGLAPLRPEFDLIAAIDDREKLARAFARGQEIGTGAGFWFGSGQDAKRSETVIAQAYQGGLGLPDRDYYLKDDADSVKLRAAYVAHLEKMFGLLGDKPPIAAANAKVVMDLETRLAKASMNRVEERNPEATYHRMSLDEAKRLMPNFSWDAFLAELRLADPGPINIAQPKFFRAFDEMVANVPLADWRTYFRAHLVNGFAPFLARPFEDAAFDFSERRLTGATEMQPRWKRVMGVIDDGIGEALGRLYVERAFAPEAKARMLELVENLRTALRDKIEGLPWMSEATKKEALRKLARMRVKIGYPDKWRDYAGLKIDRGSYAENVLRSNVFEHRRQLAKIGRPVDRGEWQMTPPTVNAYFDASMNEIVFPAGILQPPFFDPKADDAVNYGGIGSVIGHEMTHGFDDQGRQYDADGNLKNWWTPEDLKNFRRRAQGIVDQFNAYPIFDDLHVNGELTTGENIADLGGVKVALEALGDTLKDKPEPAKIDGFDWRQRFFLAFAQVWRSNEREEIRRLRGRTNPHSPPNYRVNGPLSNLPEFQAAFDLPAGCPMVRDPKARVEIW